MAHCGRTSLMQLYEKLAAALDSFEDEPLVIGPTSCSKELHIQTKRPMTIMEAQNGTFSAVGRSRLRSSIYNHHNPFGL
jgi:hypothetical protein